MCTSILSRIGYIPLFQHITIIWSYRSNIIHIYGYSCLRRCYSACSYSTMLNCFRNSYSMRCTNCLKNCLHFNITGRHCERSCIRIIIIRSNRKCAVSLRLNYLPFRYSVATVWLCCQSNFVAFGCIADTSACRTVFASRYYYCMFIICHIFNRNIMKIMCSTKSQLHFTFSTYYLMLRCRIRISCGIHHTRFKHRARICLHCSSFTILTARYCYNCSFSLFNIKLYSASLIYAVFRSMPYKIGKYKAISIFHGIA